MSTLELAGDNQTTDRASLRAEDAARLLLAANVASYALGTPIADVMSRGRGPASAALARQLAIYLAHVALEMSFSRIAAVLPRDRSTVGHACRRIETLRDDPQTDEWIEALVAMLRAAPAPHAPVRPAGLEPTP